MGQCNQLEVIIKDVIHNSADNLCYLGFFFIIGGYVIVDGKDVKLPTISLHMAI